MKSRMREICKSGSVRGCKTEPLTQTKNWVKERSEVEKVYSTVNMPVIRPIRELQNTTEISHFAKTLNEPIFITKNGRNDLVLMNDAVYERIMAQNEMYRKLAAAEAEAADGAELLDGMEVLKELRGKYGK